MADGDRFTDKTRLMLMRVRHTIHKARRLNMAEPPVGRDELRRAEETLDAVLAEENQVEQRPFARGERVYVLWPEGAQAPGMICREARVWDDSGGVFVSLFYAGRVGSSPAVVPAERVRRDRRG